MEPIVLWDNNLICPWRIYKMVFGVYLGHTLYIYKNQGMIIKGGEKDKKNYHGDQNLNGAAGRILSYILQS